MKVVLLGSALFACVLGTQAQGTLQFTVQLNGANEVPPNSSPYYGDGWFTLDGNVLNYAVGMGSYTNGFFLPTSAGIYGPAEPGQTGAQVFDLGDYTITFNPPQLGYGGGFLLTSQQIYDLKAGLWYVNFISSAYPPGEIRGQILPVPEPTTFALFGLSGLMVLVWRRKAINKLKIVL